MRLIDGTVWRLRGHPLSSLGPLGHTLKWTVAWGLENEYPAEINPLSARFRQRLRGHPLSFRFQLTKWDSINPPAWRLCGHPLSFRFRFTN